MNLFKFNRLIFILSICVFLLLGIVNRAFADIIDPSIKATMKIIQLHVQLRTTMNKVNFDKNKFNNKMVFLYIPKNVYNESTSILKQINKEVDFLCNNLNNNKISPYVLLSIVSALKSNVYDIYHIYPFIKCLKTYMLQNNMPENVKKEIINLLADTKTIFGSVEHKIYNANIKKGPLEGCFMAGVVYGTIVVGAYYYSSEMVEENNAPIIHDDGSVEIQEYDPWWMW